MEERERMETVPMGNGSKEELFEKGHPVIRELKSIPEIIFEEQIGMLPSSAIPVKSLFARKQMDHFHVDSLILKKIALQVLHILKKLSQKHIYPGLIELQEFYVDMDNSQYGVVLLHPEKFQLLTFEQDYEWYPEDERIFGDATLFDEKMQQIADNRLIYKILVASAKGNVKIPPLKTEADYSELFYNILSEEWKQIFENREICSYEKLQNLLEESIQMEEEFARMTKESLDEKSEQNKTKKAEELQEKEASFSENATKELQLLENALNRILNLTNDAFENSDMRLAAQVEPLEEVIDVMAERLRDQHILRLKDGVCSIDTGVVFLDVLNNAERISDHCSNVAARLIGMDAGEDYDSHTLKSIMHHNPTKDYMLEYEECRKAYLVPLEEMEA